MSEASERLHRLRALIDAETAVDDDAGLAGQLGRICRAGVRILAVDGVGVSAMDSTARPLGMFVASRPEFLRMEEAQFTLGEGPCVEASSERSPVLEDDLEGAGGRRWPAYAAAAREEGVGAVFAFPIHVGAARLGVMDVYRYQGLPLGREALRDALGLARICLTTMLSVPGSALAGDAEGSLDGFGLSAEVYQAQGALMIQLGVPLAEAMMRLRAHAYAADRPLGEISRDILAGRIALSRDDL